MIQKAHLLRSEALYKYSLVVSPEVKFGATRKLKMLSHSSLKCAESE